MSVPNIRAVRQIEQTNLASRHRPTLGFLLALPARVLILVTVLVPSILVVWLSLTDWQPTQGIPWYAAPIIGLWNFSDLFNDQRFVGAVLRTIAVVVASVLAELGLGLVLALLFLDDWPWRKLAVAVVVLPMMIVPVDAANAFFMLFNERGPVNQIIGLMLRRQFTFGWLADPNWALLPILLAEIWQWTPLMFLLLLTAFLSAPRNQWRAALSLGASPTRAFLYVLLPLTLPVILVAAIIRAIETFKIFDVIYILTRGGPGTATETISMFMYNGAFVYFRIGYIAAAALLVLIVVGAFCLALIRSLRQQA
jgi:multiple sugar transport system permease protein